MIPALRSHFLAFLITTAAFPGLAFSQPDEDPATIEVDPDDPRDFVYRGFAWSQKKEYDKAIADYNEAIRLDPNGAQAYKSRGIAWSEKKEYAKATPDFTEAIRLDPKDASAYRWRGYVWNARKDYDGAIADYSEAIRLDPKDAETYISRGRAWHYKGDPYKAMADYDEAIKVDPKNSSAHHNLGLEVMSQGSSDIAHPELLTPGLFDKAAAEFKETVRLNPKDLEAHYYEGLCHWHGLHDGDAISDMKDFLERAGWKGDRAVYATIIGHFAAIRSGKPDEAKWFLDEFHSKGDKTARLAPLVRYFRGEIDEKALLAVSTDDNTLNILHSGLAIEGLLKNKAEEAKSHAIWYKEHGAGCLEFHISSVWLHRMEHPDGNDVAPEGRKAPEILRQ